MKNFTFLFWAFLVISPLNGKFSILAQGMFDSPASDPRVIRLEWKPSYKLLRLGDQTWEYPAFLGAVEGELKPGLPVLVRRIPVEGPVRATIRIVNASFEAFDWQGHEGAETHLQEDLIVETQLDQSRDQYYLTISFVPIIRNGSNYRRLTSGQIQVDTRPLPRQTALRGPEDVLVSALADGQLFQMAVSEPGMYKLTFNFLQDELGLPVDDIDPRRLHLLGDAGGMLPTFTGATIPDDIPQHAIKVIGEEDGSFDSGDYLLFYAYGPDAWTFSEEAAAFRKEQNHYGRKQYYFLKVGNENGKRVGTSAAASNTEFITNSFDDYAHFEEDERNLLHEWEREQLGSGREWYGDFFDNAREYTYPALFEFPNRIEEEPLYFEARMALRFDRFSRFNLQLNSYTAQSGPASAVDIDAAETETRPYASFARLEDRRPIAGGDQIDVQVLYSYPSGGPDESQAWLDYITINARRELLFTGGQLVFRDAASQNYNSFGFELRASNPDLEIWNISEPYEAKVQQSDVADGRYTIRIQNDRTIPELVAFDPAASLKRPEAIGRIPNQNLHGIEDVDMVIIYHPEFQVSAQRLADHRTSYSGLRVRLVNVLDIYREFSSGRVDPSAIRNFNRMLFQREPDFRYVLLFGDGSFDNGDYYSLGQTFIPTYQNESLTPIFAFPADDYFAIMNNQEGNGTLQGMVDLAIGRFTVRTPEEAAAMVEKVIHYDINPNSFTDWRNRLVFVGDDEDNMTHTDDADDIAEIVKDRFPNFNIDKLYLDAFPQQSGSAENRIPQVNERINQNIFKGTVAVTYLGHGGINGWAQERVLTRTDINSWRNYDLGTILITATCSFTAYDESSITSAGEEAFLNERGGATALMTTTRAVFAAQNARLTEETMKALFELDDRGQAPTLGEVIATAKNRLTGSSTTTNSRKFCLIGDPAMRPNIARLGVRTTKVDSLEAGAALDTLRALQKVTVEGEVVDLDGNRLENFNGEVFPTVYDKAIRTTTLGQDPPSYPYSFTIQNSILFKGRATVSQGRFQFSFVVPKDINFEFGNGRISYYAADPVQELDAAGSFEEFIIGGFSDTGLDDQQGPLVQVFMNSTDFVFGGITDNNPTLVVQLEDENGINVVGNSIGHDLEAVLDGNTQNTFRLNDFFEAEKDNFQKGEVRFPLSDIEDGRHDLRVKAWDVANNSAEGYTEFVVASDGKIALERVLNYPNPFTDRTCFQFDHNMANQELDVMVQIFTISGRLVKTLEGRIFSDGAIRQDDCLEWDGRDEFGDQLARGVYLYRVRVRTAAVGGNDIQGESAFEKLVILK